MCHYIGEEAIKHEAKLFSHAVGAEKRVFVQSARCLLKQSVGVCFVHRGEPAASVSVGDTDANFV